jgi:PKD repeat protein
MNTGWIGSRVFCGSITYSIATSPGPAIPPIASFAYNPGIDTAWINSPHTFVNTSTNAGQNYWDVVSYSATSATSGFTPVSANRTCYYSWGCFLDSSYNLRYTFKQIGWYKVKLRSENSAGFDMIEKVVYVDHPSRKPVANFFTNKRTAGYYDPANFYDLSLYGPTRWDWYLTPLYYGSNINTWSHPDGTMIINGNEPNPVLNPIDGGVFDVCLRVSNLRGSDTLCRKQYLEVLTSFNMCTGGVDSQAFVQAAFLFDQGGPTQNYLPLTTGNCSAGFLISPCTDSVVLNIRQFRLRNTDSVTIRNGSDANAPILKRLGGGNIPDSLRTWIGTNGQLFIQMEVNPTSGAGDSGFSFYWTSKPATYARPKASFTAPDTIYSSYKVTYNNTSTGIKVKYIWDTNGDGIYQYDSTVQHGSARFITSTPMTRKICLVAWNCQGYDTVCKNIVIMPVPSKPKAAFVANRLSGFTTDTFIFYDRSQFGANQWKWTITPANIAYLNGTSDISQNPMVLLNSATTYTIKLVATNAIGSDTVVKVAYVSAIAYNSPYTQYPIPPGLDIGISRVKFAQQIDTITPLATPTYDALYNRKKATLYRGVDYLLEIYRNTTNDEQTTKAWIDYNRNTHFGDIASEVLIHEKSQRKVVTSAVVRIPDDAPIGNSRLRIGVTYDTVITEDYAQIGVFEDYGIEVADDKIRPVVTLTGGAVFNTELNKKFNDSGATAFDNIEGVITDRIKVNGTVDTTKVGVYPLVYTVTDLYGNVSLPVTRLVQVVINQTGPVLTLHGANPMTLEVKTKFVDPGATALDNTGKDISNSITVKGTVNENALGTYDVEYSVVDAFSFKVTKTRKVEVVDTEAPTWPTLPTLIRHQINTPFVLQYSPSDNYWPVNAITVLYTGPLNVNIAKDYVLTVYAEDGSHNKATPVNVTVRVGDLVPPVISFNGLNYITHEVHTPFSDPGVTATDNFYPNVVLSRSSDLNIHKLGTYTITYTATDGAGNAASISRTVKVVDTHAPVITLLGSDPFTHTRYKAYVDPGYTVTDNYNTSSQIKVTVDASHVIHHLPGVYLVYFTAVDSSGNKAATQRFVTVSAEGAVGISENVSGTRLQVYPNPSKGIVYITVSGKGTESVKVFNLLGSLVHEQTATAAGQTMQLDLGNLKEGVYMIQIESGSQVTTRKVNIVR